MKKHKSIVFFWERIGRLKIKFRGNQAATLRFTPSITAVQEGIASAKGSSQGSKKGEDIH